MQSQVTGRIRQMKSESQPDASNSDFCSVICADQMPFDTTSQAMVITEVLLATARKERAKTEGIFELDSCAAQWQCIYKSKGFLML